MARPVDDKRRCSRRDQVLARRDRVEMDDGCEDYRSVDGWMAVVSIGSLHIIQC